MKRKWRPCGGREVNRNSLSHWGLTWAYDHYGNRLSQTKTKGTAPEQSLSINSATNRVNGWSYDLAGNTLGDGTHTYAFNANNQATELDSGAAVYHYDGQGARVMKVTSSETIYYFGGAEYSSVSGWKKQYSGPRRKCQRTEWDRSSRKTLSVIFTLFKERFLG